MAAEKALGFMLEFSHCKELNVSLAWEFSMKE